MQIELLDFLPRRYSGLDQKWLHELVCSHKILMCLHASGEIGDRHLLPDILAARILQLALQLWCDADECVVLHLHVCTFLQVSPVHTDVVIAWAPAYTDI